MVLALQREVYIPVYGLKVHIAVLFGDRNWPKDEIFPIELGGRLKNLLVIICLMILNQNGFASSVSGCWQEIGKAENWQVISDSDIDCMVKGAGASDALKYLCAPDSSTLSDSYKIYVEYEKKYNAKAAEYLKETDKMKRILLQNELKNIEQDWILSDREETATHINTIEGAHYFCTKH